jgi:hypothetical protein
MMLNQFFAQLKSAVAPLLGEVRNLVLEWTKPLNETLRATACSSRRAEADR